MRFGRWILQGLAGATLALLGGASAGACAGTAPVVVVAPPPPPKAGPPLAWPFWEPVERPLHPSPRALGLPLDETQMVLSRGAEARWRAAPEAVRDAVQTQGFAVRADGTFARIGDVYARATRDGTPAVLTLDALFFLVHVARERVLADVEARVIAPAMDALLRRLSARLAAEEPGARPDLLTAYRLARELVAVALALEDPSYAPPHELADAVTAELGPVLSHGSARPSPLFGAIIDYSRFSLRGALREGDAQGRLARAATWLAEAPLTIAASSEEGREALDVGHVRAQTRAALIVARLLVSDVDPIAAKAWSTLTRLADLAVGPPADMTPRQLAEAALTVGLDARDPAAIANVARLDRLRHTIARTRPLASVRLLGLRAVPDADVMQALVAPRIALRTLPSALDVAAWLGSAEARAQLREGSADAYEGYEPALEELYRRRPQGGARHGTFYLAALDAIGAYLAPSSCDGALAGASGRAWRERKLETALGAWTELRHDALPFARAPLRRGPVASPPPVPDASAVIVEPHPEAIARLLAHVRQIEKGLSALQALPADVPSRALLKEVGALLGLSLDAAVTLANDEPLRAEQARALSTIPSRIAAIEARVAPVGGDEAALAADVHSDLGTGRVLEERTGPVREMLLVLREPVTGRAVLAVGAAITHREVVLPAAGRLSDEAWRAELREKGSLP